MTTAEHTQKDGTKTAVPAPMTVKEYNSDMGKDKADVLQSFYDCDKIKNGWHTQFPSKLTTAIHNKLHYHIPASEFKHNITQAYWLKEELCLRNKEDQDKKEELSVLQ
jgi:hypothetical protein